MRLFYLVDGLMDSSFLTLVNVALSAYSIFIFLRFVLVFGRPNRPILIMAYLGLICAASYFTSQAAANLGFMYIWNWEKWRALPLMTGGFCLFFQTITMVGTFTPMQLKVITRVPIMASLLCLFFFPSLGAVLFAVTIVAGCIFLSVMLGKARYQKRQYFKMVLFIALFVLIKQIDSQWALACANVSLMFALFYFSIFEQSFGVASKVERYQQSREGVVG